jgi:hypothetical protein
MSTTRHVVLGPQTCYNQHVYLYMYMHVNNTTCRVGSNTTSYNQHVSLFVHACQQYDMSCWVQHTCYNQHVHVYACQQHDMSNTHVIISMYMYIVNNTTCRVGSNTICYNQHVCLFVHAYQQHDMSCRVQHHTSTTRQGILSTYGLTKKMICIFLCRMPCLCRCCNLSTWSMLQLINLVNSTTYRLGRWCDISTWLMLRPMHLVDGTTHRPS